MGSNIRKHIGKMDYSRLSTYSMLVMSKLNGQFLVFGGNLPNNKVREWLLPREHEGTERDTEGVGCDMS